MGRVSACKGWDDGTVGVCRHETLGLYKGAKLLPSGGAVIAVWAAAGL